MSVDNWRKCRQLVGEIAKADAFKQGAKLVVGERQQIGGSFLVKFRLL